MYAFASNLNEFMIYASKKIIMCAGCSRTEGSLLFISQTKKMIYPEATLPSVQFILGRSSADMRHARKTSKYETAENY